MLSKEHRAKLQSSALTDDHIRQLEVTGIHTDDGRLMIPYRNPDGSPLLDSRGKPWVRWRLPQQAINADPAGGKYRSRKGAGCRLYHPRLSPDHARRLADQRTPLRITEGELKAEAAAVYDPARVTVALGGVDSWRDRRSGGSESKPLPELEAVPVDGREVRLCFDSDLGKASVKAALGKLAIYLAKRGAYVLLELLPNAPRRGPGGKVIRYGVDDLIYAHGPEAFLAIAAIAEPCVKREKKDEKVSWHLDIRNYPEPDGKSATWRRAVYATALLGRDWRVDPEVRGGWWQWAGTHWRRIDGNDRVLAAIEEFLGCQDWRIARNASAVSGLLAAFRRQVGELKPAPMAGFVPCANGVLRLSDRALLPHDPARGNTWALDIPWQPEVDHSPIERFLAETLADPADVAIFRAAVHRAVVGPRWKGYIELTGPTDAGKSVVADLAIAAVGESGTVSMELATLEDRSQRFETQRLRGKRLAVLNEAQDYQGPVERLKAITGGDTIRAERKGSNVDLDFKFHGLVLVVGNAPFRPSDSSAAVLTRRRSLMTPRTVPPALQRPLLQAAEGGGWTGELAAALPGFLRWVVEMEEAEAKAALARDIASPGRIEAEMSVLLDTDPLAEWAEACLVWDPDTSPARVGTANESARDGFLFPSYRTHLEDRGLKPMTAVTFKRKLVSILRDNLGLPLPPGPLNTGEYKVRLLGSVVPQLRLRRPEDGEAPGAIRAAMQQRMYPPEPETPKPPVCNGLEKGVTGCVTGSALYVTGVTGVTGSPTSGTRAHAPAPARARFGSARSGKPVTPVTSVPSLGSTHYATRYGEAQTRYAPVPEEGWVPERDQPVLLRDGERWENGWRAVAPMDGKRFLITKGGESRSAPVADLRPCLTSGPQQPQEGGSGGG